MTIESGSCQVLYRKKRIEGPGPLAYLWHPSSARSAVTKLLSKTPWWYESIEETPSSGIKNSLYKYCTLHISSSTEMSGHLGMFPPTRTNIIFTYILYTYQATFSAAIISYLVSPWNSRNATSVDPGVLGIPNSRGNSGSTPSSTGLRKKPILTGEF